MARFYFHALIALTLALNGFTAPLAMARMDQAAPAPALELETHDATPALAVQQKHPCHEEVGTPATESSSAAQPVGIQDESSGNSCCGSAECHCGCALSLALPFAHLALGTQALTATESVVTAPPPALRRGTPPFRPPAA